jgi:(S)-ureidoglycine aminohydrolase
MGRGMVEPGLAGKNAERVPLPSTLYPLPLSLYPPHDKGGIRRYFDRATAACSRFEMHVTTLKPGIRSHEPHTHRAAEIVLMIRGNTELQIGDGLYQGADGAVYFMASEIPHAIRNTGDTRCSYFAFQWE